MTEIDFKTLAVSEFEKMLQQPTFGLHYLQTPQFIDARREDLYTCALEAGFYNILPQYLAIANKDNCLKWLKKVFQYKNNFKTLGKGRGIMEMSAHLRKGFFKELTRKLLKEPDFYCQCRNEVKFLPVDLMTVFKECNPAILKYEIDYHLNIGKKLKNKEYIELLFKRGSEDIIRRYIMGFSETCRSKRHGLFTPQTDLILLEKCSTGLIRFFIEYFPLSPKGEIKLLEKGDRTLILTYDRLHRWKQQAYKACDKK